MDRRTALALLGFSTAYGFMAWAALYMTRFDGGVAFVWVSTALLIARLTTLARPLWKFHAAGAFIASMAATSTAGYGWQYAPIMAVANVGEAVVVAHLLMRVDMSRQLFGTLRWLFVFFACAGLLGPVASAVTGPVPVSLLIGQDPQMNALHWVTGHGLGNLTFTPLFTFLFTKGWHAEFRQKSNGDLGNYVGTFACVLAVCVITFAQSSMPLLFLPLLAIVVATYRLSRFGTTVSIVLLVVVSIGFTVVDAGPIHLMAGSTGAKAMFLQFYLAATALTVLPVSIDRAHRQELYRVLGESNARYRMLADHSTDIIFNLDLEGTILFASNSVSQMGGFEPADLVGTNARELVVEEYRPAVRMAHIQALTAPHTSVAIEYEARTRTGQPKWFESNIRAVVNEHGEVEGSVNIIRDISGRKLAEQQLSKAALSDPLTGLPNRRAFTDAVAESLAANGLNCVAVFDIDHFKQVNDTYGHAGGDCLLDSFAQMAMATLRTTDLIARIGGEEFAVLLRGADLEQARLICERVVLAASQMQVYFDGQAMGCTVSCGLASLAGEMDASLHEADLALYRAKNGGRNRLVIAEPEAGGRFVA